MTIINTKTSFKGCVDSRKGGRTDNQDSCGYADTPLGLLVVVCDGMGGGPGGKLASLVAVDTIIDVVKAHTATDDCKKTLLDAISAANSNLLRIVTEKPVLSGMGSTVVALLINDRSAIVAHVGDSRVYQLRGGSKKFRTFDHSMVFELLKKGIIKTEEEARTNSSSNVITRALGHGNNVVPDIIELPYEKGDRFMLCTDGTWGAMEEKELINIAGKTADMSGAIESLLIRVEEIGQENGGTHDNYSVAFVETLHNSILKEKMSTNTRKILIGLIVLCGVSLIFNLVQLTTGKDKITAATTALAEKNDTTVKAYKDTISKLHAKLNMLETENNILEAEKNKLGGEIKGMERGIAITTAKPTATTAAKPTADKNAIINMLSEIIKQLEEMKSGKKVITRAAIDKIENNIENIKKNLSAYGCDTYSTKKCLDRLRTSKSKNDCGELIKEMRELSKNVKNHK